jgi:arginyl-tRNA synthetase
MEPTIRELITAALRETYHLEGVSFVVEHPKDLSHGDYASNVALVAAKQLGKNPKEVAEELVGYLTKNNHSDIALPIAIAGPGFINFTLSNNFFIRTLGEINEGTFSHSALWKDKHVMVEYTDPNPFKPFHIGHLMTNAIGESIARIIEISGGQVIRANYQGDVGLHVAKAIYGLMQKGQPEQNLSISQQAQYIGDCYVYGSEKYDTDEEIKSSIDAINKKVYERTDTEINNLYDWGKKVTLEAFEEIYKTLGTKFNCYFLESDMAEKGRALVEQFLQKGVFTESEGAIVFKAEQYDPKLHTRVFITRNGLPTYETKELGLTERKFEMFKDLDQSIVITAVEQKDYMAVATEAMRHIHPQYAAKMRHITHGMMRFASGKMSSRKGNVITGESLLNDAIALAHEKAATSVRSHIAVLPDLAEESEVEIEKQIGVAAIKYAILRQAIGGDIIYDSEQSISFEGDSGPYLQYATARAINVMKNAEFQNVSSYVEQAPVEPYLLEKILYRFPEVVRHAAEELEPHLIATFLIELASRFNTFYNDERIADPTDPQFRYKYNLTAAFVKIMSSGLTLLGISVPEKM